MSNATSLVCAVGLATAWIGLPSEDREAYETAGKDPVAHVKLALWCERHGLDTERLRHLGIAAALDPDNGRAAVYVFRVFGLVFLVGSTVRTAPRAGRSARRTRQ